MKIDWKKFRKTKWYRQETAGVNYFIYGPCTSVLELLRGDTQALIYSKSPVFRFYFSEDFFLRLAKAEVKKFRGDRDYLKRTHSKWVAGNKELQNYITLVSRSQLKRLSNKRLLSLNKKLGKLGRAFWRRPIFLDIFDTNADYFIQKELKREKVSLSPNESSILLSPETLLVAQLYQKDLLGLARSKVGQHRKAKKIEGITKKYYFLNCSYAEATSVKKSQVASDLKDLERRVDDKGEFDELANFKSLIRRKKKRIIKDHKLSRWLVDLHSFFAKVTLWRDERKAVVQKTVFYLNLLGQEIARRSKLSMRELKIVPPFTINSIPVSKKLIGYYSNVDKNDYLLTFDPSSSKIVYLNKQTCDKMMRYLEVKKVYSQEIRGEIASVGKARGRVKVVGGEMDFKKFQKNDILVTAMTRPEFLPLMRKAAGIVTDEGGITSHAAIISRELGKPCVIGTKNATRILKDGDLVVVDGNHGRVRRV